MAFDVQDIVYHGWVLTLTYFPLGVIGFWRWGVWLIKKSYAVTYRPQLGEGVGTVAVVTPVYNEGPVTFSRALNSWRDNRVDEIVAVIDHTDERCITLFNEFARTFPGAKLIVTKKQGKRPALVDGIKVATTEFVALVDSDTHWDPGVKAAALVPFADPKIGGVATRQSVLDPKTLAQRIFNAQLNVRYLEELPFMMGRGGKVITCLSGRTSFYRRVAIMPLLPRLLHETFWGKPVISGDDKRLTYLLEGAGWHVAFQQSAHVYTPGMPGMKQFLKQRLRWTRNSWRADLRTLTQKWVWRYPRFVFYLLDRVVQPFAQLLSPLFLLVALALGLWIPAIVLIAWWHFARIIRWWPYLRRNPRELVLIPLFVLFNFYAALVKVYALVTLNRQGWMTRWDADRLPGAPPWLRVATAYVVTGVIVGSLGAGVVQHERKALAEIQQSAPERETTNLISLTEAPAEALAEPVFSGGQVIEGYEVQTQDTLMSLARAWGVSVADIQRANAGRLPSLDHVEIGLLLDRPSVHHTAVTADYASQYQELGPRRIEYIPETNTIEVRGRGQQVTLASLAREFGNELVRREGDGTWYLAANVAIKAGVTLRIRGPEVSWLKLRSDETEQVSIIVESGQLLIAETKVTSWDEGRGQVDMQADDGRSYLVAKGNARLDIESSEVAYLGQPAIENGPVGTTGVAWHLADAERGVSIVTGHAWDSSFHHNYDGLYVSGGVGLSLARNEIANNERYGIDVFDASHDLVVANNTVHRNGKHGIILAAGSFANDVRDNDVRDNADVGIMLYAGSNHNRIANNTVTRHVGGIVLNRSHSTVIEGNSLDSHQRGVRFTESRGGLLAHNTIRNSGRAAVYLDAGSGENSVRNTTLTAGEVGVYILSSNNRVRNNRFEALKQGIALHGAAANNWLLYNQFSHGESDSVFVRTVGANYIVK